MDPSTPPVPGSSSPRGPEALPATEISRSFSLTQVLAVVFLLAQAGFVAQTHFSADNPRRLTPVEGLTRYDLHARRDEHTLSAGEIEARYGLAAHDDLGLTAEAVQSVILHWEEPIPLTRAVIVRLHTREPDGTEEYWLWPQE